MKKTLLILLLLLYNISAKSQSISQRIEKLYIDITIGAHRNPDTDQRLKEVNELLDAPALTPEERLQAWFILSYLHKLNGENQLALDVTEKAIVFASKQKLLLWQSKFLGFKSSIYRQANMIALGEENLLKAIDISRKVAHSNELFHFYYNAYYEMAYYAEAENKNEEALSYMHYSIYWAKKIKSKTKRYCLASNYQQIGVLFNHLKQTDSALFYFNSALELIKNNETVNNKTLKNYAYVNMGETYLMKQKFAMANQLFSKVSMDSSQYKTLELNKILYNNWMNYYQYTGKMDSLKIYKAKLDSVSILIAKENNKTINNITQKLYSENKSYQKINKSNFWNIALILMISGGALFWVFRNRNIKIETFKVKDISVKSEGDILHIAKETELRITGQIKSFEDAKQYLDANISATLLANQFQTNTKYLTYVIKKLYQTDFTAYINELRIRYVVDLLENDLKYRQYKISYLAEISGYSSHSKFTAMFKKVKGCSPSEFIAKLDSGLCKGEVVS